jgi:hypothetical protein
MRHFESKFGVKKFKALLKNPKKCPIICFALDNKKYPELSKSEVHWYFYVTKRER